MQNPLYIDVLGAVLFGILSSLLAAAIIEFVKRNLKLVRPSRQESVGIGNRPAHGAEKMTTWGLFVLLARAVNGGFWTSFIPLFGLQIPFLCPLFWRGRILAVFAAFIVGAMVSIRQHIIQGRMSRPFPSLSWKHYAKVIILSPLAIVWVIWFLPIVDELLVLPCGEFTTLELFAYTRLSREMLLLLAAVAEFQLVVLNLDSFDKSDSL